MTTTTQAPVIATGKFSAGPASCSTCGASTMWAVHLSDGTVGRFCSAHLPEIVLYKSGELREYRTEAGSSVRLDSRVDWFNRCSSHAITGYRNGLSTWLARNVSFGDVEEMVAHFEAAGCTSIAAFPEHF